MVIVDMQLDAVATGELSEGTDAVGLAHVDQDQSGDGIEIDLLDALDVEGVGGALQEELPQAAFLGAGEDHLRLGIELAGGDHAPETVEIGVDVGGDDVHGRPVTSDQLKVISKSRKRF